MPKPVSLLVAFCVAVLPSLQVQAETTVHFWMHAFIDKEHPKLPGYTLKTQKGTWVIPAPNPPASDILRRLPLDMAKLSGSCFATDNRTFSDSPTASARVTLEFELVINGAEMSVRKADNREMVRIGITRNVDCKTGDELQPPRQASSKDIVINPIKKSNFSRVMNVSAAAADPFYAVLGFPVAPKVDIVVLFTFDTLRKKMTITGHTGYFPSFEAHYRINRGDIKIILRQDPYEQSGAFSLIDVGLGFNTRNFAHEIKIP